MIVVNGEAHREVELLAVRSILSAWWSTLAFASSFEDLKQISRLNVRNIDIAHFLDLFMNILLGFILFQSARFPLQYS